MAKIPNSPQIVMRYVMRSVLPGTGEIHNLWTRVYFVKNKYGDKENPYYRIEMTSKPLTRKKAQDCIKEHEYVLLAKDGGTEIWGNAFEDFKYFARANDVRVPDDIGATFIGDTQEAQNRAKKKAEKAEKEAVAL